MASVIRFPVTRNRPSPPFRGQIRGECGSGTWSSLRSSLPGPASARAGETRRIADIAPAAASAAREDALALDLGPGGADAAGDGLGDHFRAWLGRSGRRYIVSVHALDGADPACEYDGALLFAVKRDAGGRSVLLEGRDSGEAGAAGGNGRWVAAMRQRGATELHVHLLARDAAARQRTLLDLTA